MPNQAEAGSTNRAKTGPDWVPEDALRPWLELLATACGCCFDDDDWAAVSRGLIATNAEADVWFEYPLGSESATVGVALEPGAGVIMTCVTADLELCRYAQFATETVQRYRLSKRGA